MFIVCRAAYIKFTIFHYFSTVCIKFTVSICIITYMNGLMVSMLVSGLSGLGQGHSVLFLHKTLYPYSASLHPGLEKSAVRLSQTSRFSFWASNFSFSLARWVSDQLSHLPTKSWKSKLRLLQGKQNFRATCPKGKLEFNFFFRALKWVLANLMMGVTCVGLASHPRGSRNIPSHFM